uniref:Complement C5 n=1 Tax=Loxodonta africana TaxID=9785 RepID=G3TAK1_LOXAF
KKVPITFDNGFLFIHTDKPVYTPDQSVKVRVYSLNDDLKPAKRETVLTFIDPEGSEVDLVEENDYTGIISFPDFKIPSNPKYGVWTIRAKYKEDFSTTGTAYFEIKEYVLPHFSVLIEPENNFIGYKNFKNFEITIKARVFYNKIVTEAEVYIAFGIRDDLKVFYLEPLTRFLIPWGIGELNLKLEIIIDRETTQKPIQIIVLLKYVNIVLVICLGGFSEEAEIPGIKYILSPYKLNLVATSLFLKPGIPYSIKLPCQNADNMESENMPLFTELNSKKSITHVNDGVASFVVNLRSGVTALEFDIKTDDPVLPEENQASKEYRAIAYSSLSQSYLYIDWTENYKALLVGEHLSIIVTPKSPYIEKITHYNYLILSKGKIVHFGTREKFPDSSYQSINIPVTQNMVPSARLLVYYIVTGEQTAELVSDSVWLNIEEKCGNQLQVSHEVHLSPNTNVYSPGQDVSLTMATESDSWVALTAVDSAVYGVRRTTKKPMEKVFQELEKSDLGCGAGGGHNNADVFHLAGLTFLTNANADDSQGNDEPCKEILRPRRMLKQIIDEEENKTAKYKHAVVKKCCYDGASRNDDESCDQRAARITIGPRCIAAFNECCIVAKKFRDENPHKNIQLGRLQLKSLLPVSKPEIRSYFPESWLWEVHHVPKSTMLSISSDIPLPDSLTTWEIQGVGISDSVWVEGICVADTLKATVFKDVFLEMNIPYSVVRGEQIQLKGTVYNYKTSGIQVMELLHTSIEAEFSSCSSCHTHSPKVEGSSSHFVTFTLLPLEIGLHNINFTLETSLGKEILVKTLRVVPEGVKRESHAGVTLDPKGIYVFGLNRRKRRNKAPDTSKQIFKKSAQNKLLFTGLLIGELMSAVLSQEGIDILTHLPKGSAEAELMSVVPIFYVFHYLEAGNNWNIFYPDSYLKKQNLKKQLKEGMVSIMSYRNSDHSYSMWRGGSASTWLTAFALRVLGQVNRYIEQNQNLICNTLLWLIENCQLENGSFKENSQYQPVKLQGTLPTEAKQNTLYLTAFTVIGIRKAFDICPLMVTNQLEAPLTKAETFLLENTLPAQSTFTLAIAAYALSLGDSTHRQFRSIASALKREALVKGKKYYFQETTAYALLTCLGLKDMNYVNPIIKWLSEEQRYGGGFYSTQDTINAIEGLTEYSLLVKQLRLDMDINISYKNRESRNLFVLVWLLSRSEFSTQDPGFPTKARGRTLGKGPLIYGASGYLDYKRIVACARLVFSLNFSLLPNSNTIKLGTECSKMMGGICSWLCDTETSSELMDISLPTGMNANIEDLKALVERVDQISADYQIKDGRVILQLNSIPTNEFLCVRFRIFELFQVGFQSPATFTVYEYHRPDKQCTMFYSPSHTKLQKVCEGATCQCVEADCGQMQEELDLTISPETRKETACKPEIAYAYQVSITSITEENVFVKYTATLLDIFKAGAAVAEKDSEITFIKKITCANADLKKGKQYLIMGKEALQIKHNFRFKYIYPLDSLTWIEYWPTDATCSSCQAFLANLQEFAEDIFLNGCEN